MTPLSATLEQRCPVPWLPNAFEGTPYEATLHLELCVLVVVTNKSLRTRRWWSNGKLFGEHERRDDAQSVPVRPDADKKRISSAATTTSKSFSSFLSLSLAALTTTTTLCSTSPTTRSSS